MMRIILWLVTLIYAGLYVGKIGLAAEPATDLQLAFGDKQLIISLQGKGSSLSYDAGVLAEAYRQIPALRENRVILTGNSSGAVLAAYFSCFGFSEASLADCRLKLQTVDLSAIKKVQQIGNAVPKILRGEKTELPIEGMRDFVACALGVDAKGARSIDEVVARAKVQPRYPFLIVAGNREVLDNRAPGGLLVAADYKEVDPRNLSVSWKPEVYEFYRQHPERFAKEHPALRLGPDRYIGKAVTHFVDPATFELLRQIPVEERTGDLRLVSTAADLATALMASIAEPTYFDPVLERDPGKLLTATNMGELGTTVERRYCGGMFVVMPVQDLRRMLPDTRVLGTGWIAAPYAGRKLVQSWYVADSEQFWRLTGWWADHELQPNEAFRRGVIARSLTVQQEYDEGVKTAHTGLSRAGELPTFVSTPFYTGPAARALTSPALPLGTDAFETATDGKQRLKAGRGLGELLQRN